MLVAVGNCWADASERGRENGRGNELNRQSPPVYAPERSLRMVVRMVAGMSWIGSPPGCMLPKLMPGQEAARSLC